MINKYFFFKKDKLRSFQTIVIMWNYDLYKKKTKAKKTMKSILEKAEKKYHLITWEENALDKINWFFILNRIGFKSLFK